MSNEEGNAFSDVMVLGVIERLRTDNAKLRMELSKAHELLHKLTAIIPGNDTAGEEVSRLLRAAAAAFKETGDE